MSAVARIPLIDAGASVATTWAGVLYVVPGVAEVDILRNRGIDRSRIFTRAEAAELVACDGVRTPPTTCRGLASALAKGA